MTVKELIEMLETCDKESIVYINCGDDINSIDEIYDYSNNCGELGKQYAMEEVVNDLWAHLGFVLQWAKYGLKK